MTNVTVNLKKVDVLVVGALARGTVFSQGASAYMKIVAPPSYSDEDFPVNAVCLDDGVLTHFDEEFGVLLSDFEITQV